MPEKGKYDAVAEALILSTQADMVLVMISGGRKGSGFSVSTMNPNHVSQVPRLLREIADKIEQSQSEAT